MKQPYKIISHKKIKTHERSVYFWTVIAIVGYILLVVMTRV